MFGADTSVKSHELGNHVPFIPDYLPFLASRGPVAPKCNLPPSPAVQSLFLVTHSPSSTLKSPMVKAPFLFIFNHVWNLLAQVPRESQGGGGGGGSVGIFQGSRTASSENSHLGPLSGCIHGHTGFPSF